MPHGITKEAWDSITNPDVKEIYLQTGWNRRNFVATLTTQRLKKAREDLTKLKKSKVKIGDIDYELRLREEEPKKKANMSGAWAAEFVEEWNRIRAAAGKRRRISRRGENE